MQPRAFLYCRISDDKTGNRLGVERQEADCRHLAEERGFKVAAVFADNDISAYSGKRRPGYREMLERMDECDVILAWHNDRLHRSPIELEEYIELCVKHQVKTHTVKGGELDLATPEGMLRAGLLGQVARYESAHKAQRVRRAMEQKARSGQWTGGRRPFGWVFVNGVPELHDAESVALVGAFQSVLRGKSLGSIIREMNEAGLRTTAGKPWGYAQLRQALLRPRNAGLAEWQGEIVGTSECPPIVSEDVWRAVKSILEDPARRRSQSNKAVHLLAGIAKCHCGQIVKSATSQGRNGERYPIYRCPTAGRGHVGKRTNYVDDVVNRWVVGWLSIEERASPNVDFAPQIEQLETETLALRRRLEDAAMDYADGAITSSQLRTISARVRAQQLLIEEQLATSRLEAERPTMPTHLEPIGLDTPAGVEWLGKHIDDRRDLVRRLFEVVLLPHHKGSARVFDTDTVRVAPKGHRALTTQEDRAEARLRFENRFAG